VKLYRTVQVECGILEAVCFLDGGGFDEEGVVLVVVWSGRAPGKTAKEVIRGSRWFA
jgi:hypothetical protein